MESHDAMPAPQIGDEAPAFEAVTTQGIMHFPEDYNGKWVILFSYPADFTPVCATEIMRLALLEKEFTKLNCAIIGLSVDSEYSHIAWMRSIRDKAVYKDMKAVDIRFPVIADKKAQIARKFGMIHAKHSDDQAVRSVFFIDPESKVRAVMHYPIPNGRNIDEFMRLLIAMQTSDKHKIATPTDWQPGEDVIVPPPMTVPLADARMSREGDYRLTDWFMCFKPMPKR